MALQAAVFTANHGYDWSTSPAGISSETVECLLAEALSTRPDFADDDAVSFGIAACGGIVAAFSIRRARGWDAVGRDADYAAFAFVPRAAAAEIDFGALLDNPFFKTPTRTPPVSLTYVGPCAKSFPITAPGRLLCHNRLEDFPITAAGSLLAQYGSKADRWLFLAENDTCTVTTSPWHK